jgi:phage-related protein
MPSSEAGGEPASVDEGALRLLSNVTTFRHAQDPADLMDQGSTEGIRSFPSGCEGEKADTAKPLQGLGSGVMEVALRHRGDAWRIVYAVQIGTDLWVIHAFKKKSKSGIATPAQEIDLVRERLKRLKEIAQ